MTPEERESFIASFLLHRPGSTDEHSNAVDELDEILRTDPPQALNLVQALLLRANSDELRSYIAAGPLENIVRHSDAESFRTIEAAAERDPLLRRALAEVWVGEEVSAEMRNRLASLVIER